MYWYMLTQVDKRKVYICVYVLFSVVEYFFLSSVWLVLEDGGFEQRYIDKSMPRLVTTVIHSITVCLKSTWTQDATKEYCQFLKSNLSSFIIICMAPKT